MRVLTETCASEVIIIMRWEDLPTRQAGRPYPLCLCMSLLCVCLCLLLPVCVHVCSCVEVPADCGTLGKQCCPSTYNMITDKPVPAAAWGGDACDPKGAKHGTFCQGGSGPLHRASRADMLTYSQ